MGLAPKTAIIIREDMEIETPIDEVEIDDVILVKPGGKIPVDGIVIEGNTAIDESMLTGESMPVDKKSGDAVYAASINKNGVIQFRATKIGGDTALAQIIKLVEDAQGSKAPIAQMADIVSSYFVPIVFLIAVLAFSRLVFHGPYFSVFDDHLHFSSGNRLPMRPWPGNANRYYGWHRKGSGVWHSD